MNVKLPIAEVMQKCQSRDVSISTIDSLPSGDTRLVCTTSDGAEEMRRVFAKHLNLNIQKDAPRSVPPSRW